MAEAKVSDGGRVVIPADLRQRYGIAVGDVVVWHDDGNGLTLTSPQAGIRRAQAIIAKHKRTGAKGAKTGSMVDELLAERRAEAARECGSSTRRQCWPC